MTSFSYAELDKETIAKAYARWAPVYDLVTTAAYMPNDSMALTLNGSTKWPSAKRSPQTR